MDLDGSDDYLRVLDGSGLQVFNAFSFSIWFKWEGGVIDDNVLSRKIGVNFYLRLQSSTILVFRHDQIGDGASVGNFSSINDGNWHHLIVTWDGSDTSVWMDGIYSGGEGATGIMDLSGNLIAGEGGGVGGNDWNGKIYEVRIYSEALSSAQIQKLYAQGAKKKGITIND